MSVLFSWTATLVDFIQDRFNGVMRMNTYVRKGWRVSGRYTMCFIMSFTNDTHILISGICECVTWHDKGHFSDMVNVSVNYGSLWCVNFIKRQIRRLNEESNFKEMLCLAFKPEDVGSLQRLGKQKEQIHPLEFLQSVRSCQHLDFIPMKSILDSDLQNFGTVCMCNFKLLPCDNLWQK
jgi:hypothetical protein